MKTTRGFDICVPKHVWFSSESSLGIKTHARDEFVCFRLVSEPDVLHKNLSKIM